MVNKNLVVIDIGGTHVRYGGARNGSLISAVHQIPTEVFHRGDPVEQLEHLILQFAATEKLESFNVVIGLPGRLDRNLDQVVRANNIPWFEGVRLRTILEQRLKTTVLLEHDIVLQLMGEFAAGAARDVRSVLGVYCGTGIGGAFLFNGKPIRTNSTGVEIGHIPIRDEGRLCVCGLTDCVEAYASGRHLVSWSEQHGIPLDRLFTDITKNVELARCLEQFLADEATAIAIATTLVDPELVVMGGGIVEMSSYPLERLIKAVQTRLQASQSANSVRFVKSMLGRAAAIHGGIYLMSTTA
jgi:allose kinase